MYITYYLPRTYARREMILHILPMLHMLPIANFDDYDAYTQKTIFDECLYERTKYEGDKK